MTPRTVIRRLLAVAPALIVALHFGSLWPVVTHMVASLTATLSIIVLAMVVRVSQIDDQAMAYDAAEKAMERDVFNALWSLPALAAIAVVRLWLVWMLSAPGYAVELLTLEAIMTAINLGIIAVTGMPPRPKDAP
ncbi:hypothetical protein [Methylobacterium hispanicum]|uniref:hypothetical protein n=1 Tax=Methylobacterium hispanicum TaxID=270350 RepID=UPI002F2CED85